MKRILITGGAGFIGSNLCGRLLGNPDNYFMCMDDLYTGRICNIEKYMDNGRLTFIHHNITEAIDIPVDEIYNATCPISPVYYQKYPAFITRICVAVIINILDLVVKYNVKIMQFSTSEVYDDSQVHPQPETYRGCVNPVGIRSCYDEEKKMCIVIMF